MAFLIVFAWVIGIFGLTLALLVWIAWSSDPDFTDTERMM